MTNYQLTKESRMLQIIKKAMRETRLIMLHLCNHCNWLFILVPQTEHLMCGTQKVGIMHDGLIKVLYEDGTIVGYVQEGR